MKKTSSRRIAFYYWVAWKQLDTNRSKKGLSFMTLISIAGVAVGVTVLIVVLSVMGGFEQDLKNKMLRGQPHIEILAENPTLGFPLAEMNTEKVVRFLPESVKVAPFTQGDVVAKHGKHLAAVSLYGIDSQFDNSMWAFYDTIVEGQIEDLDRTHTPLLSFEGEGGKFPGIIVGEGVAGQLGIDIGEEMTILSPQAASGAVIFSGGTVSRTYVVVGIFASRIFDYDSKWAVVNLNEGRKFLPDYDPTLDKDHYVTGIAVNLKDPVEVSKLRNRVKSLKGYSAVTWEDTNSALLFALQLEKYTMGAILMLIVLVAAFSISGTMMMTVFHKKTQVCLLRSIGMSQRDIADLFVIQGLIIGIIGVALGICMGLALCFVIYQLRYIDIPSSLLSIRNLPVRFLPVEYCLISGLALVLTVVGALYPAIIASRQNPSSGLRYS